MKIKLSIHAAMVMAVLVCPYLRTKAQSCSSTTGAANGSSFSTTAYSGSSFSWSNPGNAQLSDGSYATAGIPLGALATAYSDYLVIQDFGFSIPSTATICEIIVDVQRSASGLAIGGGVSDKSIRLLQNGALAGNDLAAPATNWPGSDGTVTYGNALLATTWGGSWQPSDVNNPNFGVAISTQLNTGLVGLFMHGKINQVRVTIIYDPNTVLGINLGRFSAAHAPDGDGHLLTWTAGATVNGRFVIQRSGNGRDWLNIGNVQAVTGGTVTGDAVAGGAVTGGAVARVTVADKSNPGAYTPSTQTYAYTDHAPLDGANFYRLQLQNTEGKTAYSTVSEVIKEDKTVLRCWPNPFVNTINISSPQPVSRVVVKDVQGRTLFVKQTGAPIGDWQIPATTFPPGLYFVQVGGRTFKVLKQAN